MNKLAELSRQIEEARERDSQFVSGPTKGTRYFSRVEWLRASLDRVRKAKSEQEIDDAYLRSPIGSEAEALARYKLEEIRQKISTGGVI